MDHARLMVVWFSLSESSVANVKFLAEPEQTLIRVLTLFFVFCSKENYFLLGSSALNFGLLFEM